LHSQLGATTIYVTHDQVEAMTLADKIVVLRDGEVMQVGSPMELFNFPKNEFVAGFLGSPKMNFFKGSLDKVTKDFSKGRFKSKEFTLGGIRLVSTEKNPGDNVKLGVRPQHLFLDKKGPIKGEVILIEQLGTEIIVELKASDNTFFRFTSPKDPNLSIGELVSFNFNEEFAHLF